jgi:two-component sensor histidine kinase
MLADQIGGTLNIGKEEGIKIILEFPCERKQ